jgi:general secretion pathway protein E
MLHRKKIGEVLCDSGKVTRDQLVRALIMQEEKVGRLGDILVSMGACAEEDVLVALAQQLHMPFLEMIDVENIDPQIVMPLTSTYAKQHLFLPMWIQNGIVSVVAADPLNIEPLDDLQAVYQAEVEVSIATRETVLEAINKVFDRRAAAEAVMEEIDETDPEKAAHELEEIQDIVDQDDEAPIIRLVNSVLNQAVKEQASDIHIEPFERYVSVRFRRDGVLHEVIQAPKRFQNSIASRIKIMGDLNIAEKRLPQDGRIRIKVAGRDVDIRLSTVPTSHGERLVLRLLDKTTTVLDLQQLGFSRRNLERFESLICRPHGIVLVTGPTGSGKTTTLYAGLSRINTPDKNILTIEDPVEYQITGIGQMQVNTKINFTFASGLRATLRQDPDVVLVGEIRDMETAEIAVQASLTGHLVFSTVHTNDSASTFTRLIDMGVEPFLIASSVMACLAQRLVRKVCLSCREPYEPPDSELEQLGMKGDDGELVELMRERHSDGSKPIFYHAVGCDECGQTGYSGRLAIYELLMVSDEVRSLVTKNVDATVIKRQAVADGMITLMQDGGMKVLDGVTTAEEVFRVAQATEEVL